MPPAQEVVKTLWVQFLIPVLSAAAGSFFGVYTTLAVLSTEINNIKAMHNSDISVIKDKFNNIKQFETLSIADRNELRERVAKIEIQLIYCAGVKRK